MSDRHDRSWNKRGQGIGVYKPDYVVIANDVVGSFHRVWDETPEHDYKNNMPMFGTELVDIVPDLEWDRIYGDNGRHSLEDAVTSWGGPYGWKRWLWFDTGEWCNKVGCKHGWLRSGIAANVSH